MRPDVIRGHLDMLLLSMVASAPTHGYAILEEMRRRSGGVFDLPEGTIYPALYRLEGAGLLASASRRVNGRRRRVYRLTHSGRRALASKTREWSVFAGAVAAVMRRRSPWPAEA